MSKTRASGHTSCIYYVRYSDNIIMYKGCGICLFWETSAVDVCVCVCVCVWGISIFESSLLAMNTLTAVLLL